MTRLNPFLNDSTANNPATDLRAELSRQIQAVNSVTVVDSEPVAKVMNAPVLPVKPATQLDVDISSTMSDDHQSRLLTQLVRDTNSRSLAGTSGQRSSMRNGPGVG